MNYVNQCFLDSDDQAFLAKPSDEENEGDDGPNNEDEEETDIQVLSCEQDGNEYLNGQDVPSTDPCKLCQVWSSMKLLKLMLGVCCPAKWRLLE